MNIQTITNEPRRGCGYRKAGGLYLMGGKVAAPCGKLPLELKVCPTCGQGIKPVRSFAWVDGKKLFEGVICQHTVYGYMGAKSGCLCVLNDPPERMGLLWVGGAYYPTPESFLAEGAAQGISRRLSAIPNELVVGETWVLLAHRKVFYQPEPEKTDLPGIFAVFRPTHIEYAVKDDDPQDKLERLEKRGVRLVKLVRTDDGKGNGVLDLQEPAQED